MTIHELFQEFYADQHGLLASDISLLQMRNGSYATAAIATAFRAFKAGYEANKAGFTAVDMATAVADGFRDGAASIVIELPDAFDKYESGDFMYWAEDIEKAIIAAGGSVKE